MMVTVFGCGYVGLPLAVALAEMGYQVMGIDTNKDKIALLQRGKVPFFEPQLAELLAKNLKRNTLTFSYSLPKGVEHGVIFINTVAAPSHRNIVATLKATQIVIDACACYSQKSFIFLNRSTLPVGSNEKLEQFLAKKMKEYNNKQAFLFMNYPEFLSQGKALEDAMNPQRIIVGFDQKIIAHYSQEGRLQLPDAVTSLYETFFQPFRLKKIPVLVTTFRNAEMIKYASNAFLATKISFINEMANISDRLGIDIDVVAKGMGLDSRIGKDFLQAGIGFGGSCLPKDLESLIGIAGDSKNSSLLLRAVKDINQSQPENFVQLLQKYFLSDEKSTTLTKPLQGKKIALWGVTFKPQTDDLRDAPSLAIIKLLQDEGATVYVFDPLISLKIKLQNSVMPEELKLCIFEDDMYKVVMNADSLVVATECEQFIKADLKKVYKLMRQPAIFDGRGLWQSLLMKESGFRYYRLGHSIQ